MSGYDILSSKFLVLNFQLDKNITRIPVRVDSKILVQLTLVKMYVGIIGGGAEFKSKIPLRHCEHTRDFLQRERIIDKAKQWV